MNDEKGPLLLWLNGGPGYSSLYGTFNENGPYVVKENLTLELRNTSWNREFSVLYIDNPVGAGFSFTENEKGYARNLEDSSRDLFEGLKQFFMLFPYYSTLYLTGESYACKYLVGLAHKILNQQPKMVVPLTGAIIGNGMCDPRHQMLYGQSLHSAGLISGKKKELFEKSEQQIRDLIDARQYLKAYHLWDWLMLGELTNGAGSVFGNATGYSYRYNQLHDRAPEELKYYERFVVLNSTRAALHVGNRPFSGNSFLVEQHLFADFMVSAAPLIDELLTARIDLLLYSGALDIIVPTISTENMISRLKWSGHRKFSNARRRVYREGKGNQTAITGYIQQAEHLTLAVVINSGHILPYEQPSVALDLVAKFVNSEPFTN